MREGERLAASFALLTLAMLRATPAASVGVTIFSAVLLRWYGRSPASIATWLVAPLPFLVASTLAGWWAMSRGTGTTFWEAWHTESGVRLLAQALRAEACTAAVGIGVLSVSVPVAAASARRLGVPAFAIDVLVLALRTVQIVGHTLRARMQNAPLRHAARSASTRLRTSGLLAATLAAVTHHRVRRLDAMMDLRGTPDWCALASLTPPARPLVIGVVFTVAAIMGIVL